MNPDQTAPMGSVSLTRAHTDCSILATKEHEQKTKQMTFVVNVWIRIN